MTLPHMTPLRKEGSARAEGGCEAPARGGGSGAARAEEARAGLVENIEYKSTRSDVGRG